MPRLSLYRPTKSNDYKFLDRSIKEMFTVGATDLYIHKYLGPSNQGTSTDSTQPQNTNLDPTKIQDLLFLENRDRTYAPDIYILRGHYNVQNLDFDLSQFGLFLNNDIIFITVHYNDMIDTVGRKLMVGDVFELPHLIDYHPLNDTLPIGLRRYYQITDSNFASEGFTQTWYPHLWRIKCEPLVDSQEFSTILSQPINKDNYLGNWNSSSTYVSGYTVTYGDKTYTTLGNIPAGTPCTGTAYSTTSTYSNGSMVTENGITYMVNGTPPEGTPVTNTTYFTSMWQLDTADALSDIISRYNTNIAINDAAIAEAARLVPKNGYDRSQLYLVPTVDARGSQPANPVRILSNPNSPTPIRGELALVYNPKYKNPSPAIRIGAAARKELFKLTEDDIVALHEFVKVNLQQAEILPERTDTGSGLVESTPVLKLQATSVITEPYGTADNTYSYTDQYPSVYLIAAQAIPTGSATLHVQQAIDPLNLDTYYDEIGSLDLDINASLSLTDGTTTLIDAFAPGTLLAGYDSVANTISISKPTIANIPVGATITLGSSFKGNPIQQNVMDYRADADPDFTYIKQFTPQGFGYTNGYLIGDGTAPNGLPTGSGITFPTNPSVGDYFLRTDYLPNILYRYDGTLWVRIGVNVRAQAGTASSETLMGSFVNNTATTTLTNGTTIPQQQPLSNILKIQVD